MMFLFKFITRPYLCSDYIVANFRKLFSLPSNRMGVLYCYFYTLDFYLSLLIYLSFKDPPSITASFCVKAVRETRTYKKVNLG